MTFISRGQGNHFKSNNIKMSSPGIKKQESPVHIGLTHPTLTLKSHPHYETTLGSLSWTWWSM